MKLKTAVVILNWNAKEMTTDCINSLLKNTKNEDYVGLLVDNGSTDGSVNHFKKKFGKMRAIKLLELDKNYGFTLGMNKGVDYAIKQFHPEYVVPSNNDIIFQKGWLSNIYKVFKKDLKIAVVSATLLNFDKTLQTAGTSHPKSKIKLLKEILSPRGVRFWYKKQAPKNDREIDSIMGACFAIRRNLIKTHLFDEKYSPYNCEEEDLFYNLKKRGYKVFVSAKSKVLHLAHMTFSKQKINLRKNYISARNAIYFSKKNLGYGYVFPMYLLASASLFLGYDKNEKIFLKTDGPLCRIGYTLRLFVDLLTILLN